MKMTRLMRILLVVSMLVATLSGTAGAAKPGSGEASHGTKEPFSLGLRALKGPTHTDLYVNVAATDPAYNAPDSLQKIQLKSFTEAGELVYTRNLQQVAAPGGAAVLQLTDVERYQPLKTQVLAKTAQTVDQEVLAGITTVLLRPDLIVDNVEAPAQTPVNVQTAVLVTVKETNVDVGATAKVSILDGNTVLDHADGVVVSAGGAKGVALGLTFAQPGTYTLKVAISDADPDEYDTSNNEATFTIEAVSPNQTMNYWASYYFRQYESNGEYRNGTTSESFRHRNNYEGLNTTWWTPGHLDLAGTLDLTLTNESGAVVQVNLTDLTPNTPWGAVQKYYPALNAWVFTQNYGNGTYVTYQHFSQLWHYSYNWTRWGGSDSYLDEWQVGQVVGARSTLTVHLDLPASTGTHYGGTYVLNLRPAYHDEWDNTYVGWGDYYSHSWGSYGHYYGTDSGVTTW